MALTQYLWLASVGAVTFIVIRYWLKNKRFFELARQFPGPPAYPVVGNLWDFIKLNSNILEIVKLMANYDGIARFWMGDELTVAITDPEYLEVMYNSDALLSRPEQYTTLEDWVGMGNIVTSGGEKWKKAKKIMNQDFHAISAEELCATMTSECHKLVRDLDKIAGKGTFEILPHIRRNLNTIVTRIAINEDLSTIKDLDAAILSIEELTRISVLRYLSPVHYFYPAFTLTKEGKRFKILKANFRGVMRKIVVRKRKEYNDMIENGIKPSNCFIYNLLKNHGDESLEDLTTHLITLTVAGVDTIENTTGFMLHMAAIHPEIQEKLHQEDLEVQARLGAAELGPATLQHYEYLDRVFRETLRLFPGFPMTGRLATEEIKMGKYTIPKGASVMSPIYYINRKEDLFPNPSKFDPDRFLPENAKNMHPYVFSPFGLGSRKCAGTKYGLLATKIGIIMLIRNFKFYSEYKSVAEVEKNLWADIVLRDTNHVRLRIELRKEVRE